MVSPLLEPEFFLDLLVVCPNMGLKVIVWRPPLQGMLRQVLEGDPYIHQQEA